MEGPRELSLLGRALSLRMNHARQWEIILQAVYIYRIDQCTARGCACATGGDCIAVVANIYVRVINMASRLQAAAGGHAVLAQDFNGRATCDG